MDKTLRYVVTLGASLWVGLMAGPTDAQGTIGPSLADAKTALAATEAAATEMGVGLSCAVVDSRGALVALTRMDSARYFTADVAVGKARASATFGAPSGGLGRIGSLGLGNVIEGGEMLFLQGAVPIMKDGQPVGALGCSGASAQQDEDAANAGVAAMP
jgi:glc operon protein GlcG